MLQAFFIAWLGVCAAQASPGPNLMAVADAALDQGRRPALFVVTGIATGCLAWALLTALGLGALFAAYPMLLTVLKFAGGGYLLYLGIRALWSMRKGRGLMVTANTGQLSDLAAWRRGFVVVMTNPKAALMWSAIATFLLGAGLSRWEVLLFGPIVAATALTIYGTYALLFSTGMATSVYDRFVRIIQGVFGVAFGALGGALVWSGLRDLRS